jgi:ubiquinone/menaquinone biosynthesis C-methylase UbiE
MKGIEEMSDSTKVDRKPSFAELYEEFIVPTMSGPWAPKVVAAADILPGDKVLDIGCGTGVLSREAAERVNSENQISGIDINPEMLSVARRLRPNIDWHQGDAAKLPFDTGSFDVVVSQFVLMFVPDKIAALKEMWRVMTGGGRLSVAVWWRSSGYPILADIARRRINDEVADAFLAPFCFDNAAALQKLFLSAGIENPKIQSLEGWGNFSSIDEFVRIEIKGWVEGQLEGGMSNEDYNAFLKDAREKLAPYRAANGEAHIPMDVHLVAAQKS